jgi:N-acetylated-alpha-linked acidic dipeptidase
MPGTKANERTATYLAERLCEFGFDSVVFYHYEVLVPRPVERQVELVALERYRL